MGQGYAKEDMAAVCAVMEQLAGIRRATHTAAGHEAGTLEVQPRHVR